MKIKIHFASSDSYYFCIHKSFNTSKVRISAYFLFSNIRITFCYKTCFLQSIIIENFQKAVACFIVILY